MNSNRNLRLVKFAVLALLVAAFAPQALRAEDECSLSTLKGSYRATATGTVGIVPPAAGVPIAQINLVDLDGSGNGQAYDATRSVNGVITTGGTATVTYTVNADCTGTYTSNGVAHFNIVVDKKGAGFFFIRADSGAGSVVSGYTIRLDGEDGQVCSLSTLNGSYRFSSSGTVVGVGPLARVGVFSFDGSGNGQSITTTALNGNISTSTSTTFTYTVDADCSGTATFTPSGRPPAHINIVADKKGAGLFFINTDSGNVISGQAIRLDKDHEE